MGDNVISIQADEGCYFGYFVYRDYQLIRYCFTLWGARRVAARIKARAKYIDIV